MTDETITAASPIVYALARLTPEQRRAAERHARALRARQIRSAVRQVRAALMPGWSDLSASQEIEAAILGGRTGADQSGLNLRRQIKRQLIDDLGSLEDMPGAESVRKYLRE